MSTPPPYESQRNPDTRQLPPGWVSQFDSNYKTWFYVNTNASPPVTSWVHPLGAAPPPGPPPAPHSPPAGPPPPTNTGYNQGSGGQGYGYSNPQGGYSPSYGGGGNNFPQQQQPPYNRYDGGSSPQNWQQPPQQAQQGGKGMMGGLLGGLLGKHGSSGGSYGGGGYQQQPQVVYAQQQKPPKKSGFGMGGMLAAGGVGLPGGALLENAWENHEERERDDAFLEGEAYANGDDGGFFDDAGGDW